MESRKKIAILLIICILFFLASTSVFANTIETVRIDPGMDDNFKSASFDLYIPDKVKKLRYILVLVPGFNHDGRGFLKDKRWIDFAEKTGGAVLAVTFQSLDINKDNFVHYAAAQHGSGVALESAIKLFDKKKLLGDIQNLPLLIYGHSAGGQFAYGFSSFNPKRMIGFASIKGGFYFPEPVDETYKVPGLLVSGQRDLSRRRVAVRGLYDSHRKNGAPWCWLEDDSGHGTAQTISLVVPYFHGILELQLHNEQSVVPDRSRLFGIEVDLVEKKILNQNISFNSDSKNTQSGWLPSLAVFESWSRLDIGDEKYIKKSYYKNISLRNILSAIFFDNSKFIDI